MHRDGGCHGADESLLLRDARGPDEVEASISARKREPAVGQTSVARAQVVPLDRTSHLLLGISWEGIRVSFMRLGYPDAYTRDEAKLAWVTEAFGSGLTGYDFAAAVRHWLTVNFILKLSLNPAERIYARHPIPPPRECKLDAAFGLHLLNVRCPTSALSLRPPDQGSNLCF